MDPNDKNKVKEERQRTLAGKFFNNADISDGTRTKLLNATVRLRTRNAPYHIGSGVILYADNDKAYVLTAKHLLYKLAGQENYAIDEETEAPVLPSASNTANFLNSIEIGYAPAALLGEPTATAAVTGMNFGKNNVLGDTTWTIDMVVFESTDANFRTHAKNNGVLTLQTIEHYKMLLPKKQNAKGPAILRKNIFEFFQMGYGKGRIKNIGNADDYGDYEGKVQIKISESVANDAVPEDTFEIGGNDVSTWPVSKRIIILKVENIGSTGPGDSGGPLFCRPKQAKPNDNSQPYLSSRDNFYLVGVTSGADFFTGDKDKYKQNRPASNIVHNNAATFWGDMFLAK
jgi:hypothetical protein